MTKICPNCHQIVAYNSYFKAWQCTAPNCGWMQQVSITKNTHHTNVVNSSIRGKKLTAIKECSFA